MPGLNKAKLTTAIHSSSNPTVSDTYHMVHMIHRSRIQYLVVGADFTARHFTAGLR